jgi:hypothetical protein
MHSSHTNTSFHHEEGVCEEVLYYCTPIQAKNLLLHIRKTSPHQRKILWITSSIIYKLNKSIIQMYPCKQICSFKVSTTVVLCGSSGNNFVALHGDVFEILISQTSCLKRLSQWSFTSSTKSIQFLLSTEFLSFPPFCLAAILLFPSQWPSCVYSVYLEVVVLESGTKFFCKIFQQTITWNTAAVKADAVQQCTWLEACCYITK